VTVQRAYYYCPHCHQGHCPGDAAWDLGHGELTCGAAELSSLAGTLDSFAHAAVVILPKLCGLSLAEATVQRTTEAIGSELGQALQAKVRFGQPRPWDWQRRKKGTEGILSEADGLL
jgi:hypothetical protein